jgi:hypothetical protein
MIDFANIPHNAIDDELIGKIVNRCSEAMKQNGFPSEQWAQLREDLTVHAMDITAVHYLTCPLNLLQWLMSSPMDFAADYAGIVQNIDRNTGQLLNGFWPRFAVGARLFGMGLARPEKLNGTANH